MKEHPTVLCYNLRGDRAGRIRVIAMRLGIRLRPVKKEEYARTIASLLGLEEASDTVYEGEGFDQEMMVMAFFPSALLSSFLNAFRQARIPSVKLKSVLTDNNRRWDSIYLHKELSDEAAYFDAARKEAHSRKEMARIVSLHQAQEAEAAANADEAREG